RAVAAAGEMDAVFVSCTNIRLIDEIPALEAELGLPVTSSNHALAWRCLRLAGVADRRPELGRLFAR
ncbi:MAG: Asp/Glu racemase, partial [Pseudomonadota bacterium]